MPSSVVSDSAAGFYFASPSLGSIYRVNADGVLSLFAGAGSGGLEGDGPALSAKLNPSRLAMDRAGNLYFSDRGTVRKITTDGIVRTVAGIGTTGFSGDGGVATSAEFSAVGIAVDNVGNLFIADSSHNRIRKVTTGGIISTVAGNGLSTFGGDGGPATSASISNPLDVAVDSAGNLYVVDNGNYRIRKIDVSGVITTVAGTGARGAGGDGGPATSAQFSILVGIAVNATGDLFITDIGNNSVRQVTADGIIRKVAGTAGGGFSGDGGPATGALLNAPTAIAADGSGNLLIADSGNNRVRKITSPGLISTVAGNGRRITGNEQDDAYGFSGDGGPAIAAYLRYPEDVAVDASGNVFFTDTNNSRIRKITTAGIISTVAGNGGLGSSGDGGPATSAQIGWPGGIAVDSAGNLVIQSNVRIRKVDSAGIVTTLAGNGTRGFGGDGGPASAALLNIPNRVAADENGNIFISDSFNGRIRKVNSDGVITTVAGGGNSGSIGDGNSALAATLSSPAGVALDRAGNLFIVETGRHRVRMVTLAGIITTVAGTGTNPIDNGFGGDGGPATSAQLYDPLGVALDGLGNIFIADTGNLRIRMISPAGIISTIAGIHPTFRGFAGDGGPAADANFARPSGVAVDPAGNLFIADTQNNRIRKITFTQQAGFAMGGSGGSSFQSSGTLPMPVAGYAMIQPDIGRKTPAGLAIFGVRQNGALVSEATVPASSLIQSGRIYAEVNAPVNTGVAMANPNNEEAAITFFFTDSKGSSTIRTMSIPARHQVAAFLDQAPFNAPGGFSGTLSFTSSVPIAVIALRGLTNERGEFLITTLPAVDLGTPAVMNTVVFPDFADGGGWTTQIVLINPTDGVLTGSAQFLNQSGTSAALNVEGQSGSTFSYSIPPRGAANLQTSGLSPATLSGSIRIVPATGTAAPSGVAIFSFRSHDSANREITVSVAGVPAMQPAAAFRVFAESSGKFGESGSIQTGLAVTNLSASTATVLVEPTNLDGSSTGLTGTLTIPANGQATLFLNQIPGLSTLPIPFRGVLRVSSMATISLIGLRGRYNERGDFLVATTPPINEATPPSSSPLFFAHIVDSGNYTTQFVLFAAQPGQSSSGQLQFFSQAGGAWKASFDAR